MLEMGRERRMFFPNQRQESGRKISLGRKFGLRLKL